MNQRSHATSGVKPHCYRIRVRGEITSTFLEPLEHVFVEARGGDTSVLHCEMADQAKLQTVLAWLYARGVEIVSVDSDDDCGEPLEPALRQHPPGTP